MEEVVKEVFEAAARREVEDHVVVDSEGDEKI